MRILFYLLPFAALLLVSACGATQEMQQQSDWLNNAPEYGSNTGSNGAGVDNANDVGSSAHNSGFHSGHR